MSIRAPFPTLVKSSALFSAACLGFIGACAGRGQADASAGAQEPVPAPAAVNPVIDGAAASPKAYTSTTPVGQEVLASLDPAVDPCDDFYAFACGGWLANTPLPPDKPSYGRGFGELRDRNSALLRQLLESSSNAVGEQGLAGRYYASCMDESAIEVAGLQPVAAYLTEIDRVKTTKDALKLLGKYHGSVLAGALFDADIENDFKDPDLYIFGLGQSGLGLPDRSYYLESQRAPILAAYQENLTKLLTLVGSTAEQAKASAASVIAFETKLAQISKPRDELRDPEAVYHPTTRKELDRVAPIDWKTYLRAAKISNVEAVNVSVPTFFEALPGLLASTEPEVLRDYLRAFAIRNLAGRLNKTAVDTSFELTQKITGAKTLKARWERCVDATTEVFPDVVAKGYVEKHFAGDHRKIALEMIQDIEAAFVAGLPNLAWMDDATRERAKGKMQAIVNKIGFPDKWRTYSHVQLGKSYLASYVSAAEAKRKYNLDKLGKRVDPAEWFIPASMVNAFYNPLQNEMVFPAGILQPPYFSTEFPRAMNYGAMGMVMGHELTHGFDDSGRKFDGDGVMKEWWDPAVSQRFEERTQCIEKAYSAVEVEPGVNINGKLTLGENIADHGGIKESFNAYKSYVARHGAEPSIIDGLSNEQLFFVGYAQGWCTQMAPEFARFMVTVDSHSPAKYRVNLPLSHLPAFWETFQCGADRKMRAQNACEVW
jgi:predicted metalloendopeptidase